MLKSNLTRKKEKCHCFIDFWQQRKPCKKLYVFLTKRTEKYLASNGLVQLNPIITPTDHATATTVRFHINYRVINHKPGKSRGLLHLELIMLYLLSAFIFDLFSK